ncbi:sugar phosphate isomerase/epimerase family protein [Halalkalibacter kiskunsagensis]|uniref:Sugar phosphate isomerase/epimerase family protein n=1 Tax=Halalkalibacter kiskunsagensis TaxID=1548599 RepID=A0ABV6KFM0_9BACI
MKVAFHTANYFARASHYQTTIADWGAAERRVIEQFSLAEFDQICSDISAAGFSNIELWMGHAFPKFMTAYLAKELKSIVEKHHLDIIGYSCSLGDPIRFPKWTRLCFETCQMLGIEMITSGITKETAPVIYSYCREYGIKVAVENHPEKHPEEIRKVIGDYGDMLGAGVDTGWFGTQGFPAHEALRQLKGHLFHVHLKDVKEVGEHNTVELNKGVVNIVECLSVLEQIDYKGIISIENEAADRDPTNECIASLNLVTSIVTN